MEHSNGRDRNSLSPHPDHSKRSLKNSFQNDSEYTETSGYLHLRFQKRHF